MYMLTDARLPLGSSHKLSLLTFIHAYYDMLCVSVSIYYMYSVYLLFLVAAKGLPAAAAADSQVLE